MVAVKQAIRGALEKGDAQDPAFREKVYRQAFAALERSIQATPGTSAEDVRRRRDYLKTSISEIESEFQPARPAVPPSRREPSLGEPAPHRPPPRDAAPSIRPAAARAGNGDFAPSIDSADRLSPIDRPPGSVPPRRDPAKVKRRSRRRPFAMLFVLATLVAAVGIGAWWTMESGILKSAAERDTSVPNPPLLQEEDFDPDAEAGANGRGSAVQARGEWITIFSPSDPTSVSATAGVSAEVVEGEERAVLRLSGSGTDSAVRFDIGPGILERLAGRRVIFALVAQAQEGSETQISVSCNFGPLGGCGRSRYVVGPSEMEYLFETELPAGSPGSGGFISVVPDIEGQGRVLDIFSLRVSTAG